MVKKKLVLNIPQDETYVECFSCGEEEYSEKVFSKEGDVQLKGEREERPDGEWDILVSGDYRVIDEDETDIVVRPEEIFCFCPECESNEDLIE